MNTLQRISRTILITFVSLFVVFFIYANLEEPSLADRLKLEPISLAVFNVSTTMSSQDSASLATKLSTAEGITAATVNRSTATVSATYHPTATSEAAIRMILENQHLAPEKIEFSKFDGPKCPIPMGYIDFFTDIKKALCVR